MVSKKCLDRAVRRRSPFIYQFGRLRGRASGAARVYMPPEPPLCDLHAQVSAYSLILGLIMLPVKRERAHMAAPHRLDWPQPRTASWHGGPSVVVGRRSVS